MLVKVLENCSSIYIPCPAENNFLKSHCCPSNIFWEINCIILNIVRTIHISSSLYCLPWAVNRQCLYLFIARDTHEQKAFSIPHQQLQNMPEHKQNFGIKWACHLMAIYGPVLPASERWQHCTQRKRGVGNKKEELGSGATTQQGGPALFTHVFPTLPVLDT